MVAMVHASMQQRMHGEGHIVSPGINSTGFIREIIRIDLPPFMNLTRYPPGENRNKHIGAYEWHVT